MHGCFGIGRDEDSQLAVWIARSRVKCTVAHGRVKRKFELTGAPLEAEVDSIPSPDMPRRMISSPFFGKLSSKGYRSVLIQATCLTVAGATCYAAARRIEVLMAAQVLLGIGSGTLGVTRAYVADKTTLDQRTRFLAYTT